MSAHFCLPVVSTNFSVTNSALCLLVFFCEAVQKNRPCWTCVNLSEKKVHCFCCCRLYFFSPSRRNTRGMAASEVGTALRAEMGKRAMRKQMASEGFEPRYGTPNCGALPFGSLFFLFTLRQKLYPENFRFQKKIQKKK